MIQEIEDFLKNSEQIEKQLIREKAKYESYISNQ